MSTVDVQGIEVRGPVEGRQAEVVTPEALEFVAGLQRQFNPRRLELLERRRAREAELESGKMPDFLPETEAVSYTHLTLPTTPYV